MIVILVEKVDALGGLMEAEPGQGARDQIPPALAHPLEAGTYGNVDGGLGDRMANVVGQRVRRREDPRFLDRQGQYVDDLRPPDALHVQFVRSYMAHARITGIDTEAARALPGTQVFTAADIDLTVNPPPPFIQVDPRRCTGRSSPPTRCASSATSSPWC